MKKIITFLVILIFGIAIGGSGYWFLNVKQPELQAHKDAIKEQEMLNDRFYTGRVVQVSPKNLLLEVTQKSGEEVQSEETLDIEFTNATTIQEGMNFLNNPGEELDLTVYIKQGMIVNVLVDGGQAWALHFDSLSTPL